MWDVSFFGNKKHKQNLEKQKQILTKTNNKLLKIAYLVNLRRRYKRQLSKQKSVNFDIDLNEVRTKNIQKTSKLT